MCRSLWLHLPGLEPSCRAPGAVQVEFGYCVPEGLVMLKLPMQGMRLLVEHIQDGRQPKTSIKILRGDFAEVCKQMSNCANLASKLVLHAVDVL